MTSFGIYEAKTRLPQLVKRVTQGEEILITRHGRPVAMLVPARQEEQPDVREAIRRMKEFRRLEAPTLGNDLNIRELIEEGRR